MLSNTEKYEEKAERLKSHSLRGVLLGLNSKINKGIDIDFDSEDDIFLLLIKQFIFDIRKEILLNYKEYFDLIIKGNIFREYEKEYIIYNINKIPVYISIFEEAVEKAGFKPESYNESEYYKKLIPSLLYAYEGDYGKNAYIECLKTDIEYIKTDKEFLSA